MAEKQIGKVTHFFGEAGVVVVKLSGSLSSGEEVKFKKGEIEFTEKIESMQIDHKPVAKASAGDEVAVKISQKIKEGAEVLKVEG